MILVFYFMKRFLYNSNNMINKYDRIFLYLRIVYIRFIMEDIKVPFIDFEAINKTNTCNKNEFNNQIIKNNLIIEKKMKQYNIISDHIIDNFLKYLYADHVCRIMPNHNFINFTWEFRRTDDVDIVADLIKNKLIKYKELSNVKVKIQDIDETQEFFCGMCIFCIVLPIFFPIMMYNACKQRYSIQIEFNLIIPHSNSYRMIDTVIE